MKILMSFISLLMLGLGSVSHAAISQKATRPAAQNSPGAILQAAGSIHGGEAQIVSLLKVKRLVSKNQKLERIEFAMGNAGQMPLQGKPGYFNLELRPGQRQIVIGFSQALNSKFEERDLKKIFASSPYVKSSQMYFEPQTQSMNFVLNTTRPVGVRAIPVMGGNKNTARLVVDLFDAKAAPVKTLPAKVRR